VRLPFPFPDQTDNPRRATEIVAEVAELLANAAKEAAGATLGRRNIVQRAQASAETLVAEYFDVNDIEQY